MKLVNDRERLKTNTIIIMLKDKIVQKQEGMILKNEFTQKSSK
jgi:hypothetical protein